MTIRFALLALLAVAPPLAAWGPHGHQVVAEVAARELTPAARAEVEALLGDRASHAMREASTWADEIRDEDAWRHTGSWHYLNFDRGDCHYAAEKSCRNGDCVVGAIEREAAVLGDREAGSERRAQALRFVIHFVGDVHQPLHAGYRDDRGGNDFQIRTGRRGDNLHALWDQELRQARPLHPGRAARVDDALPRPAGSGDWHWHPGAPGRWAEESCGIVQRDGFYPARGRVDPEYVARFAPVVDAHLAAAGHRLGALLNQILGAPR